MTARTVLAALCGLVMPLAVSGQNPATPILDDTTAIMAAAAAHVRPFLAPGVLRIDVDSHLANAVARAQFIAAATNAQVGKATVQCADNAKPTTCRLVGHAAAIEVMTPIVQGDAAVVQLRIVEVAAHGIQPIHRADVVVRLARDAGHWTVVSARHGRTS